MSQSVSVALAGRAYEVVIGPGLIDQAGERLRPLLRRPRAVVVADQTVFDLYGSRLASALAAAGVAPLEIVVRPGEQAKSFAGLEALCEELSRLEVERGDHIVAFGGGVVGDLAGLAAAVFKRGIDFIQIPTTLLAQVDSSVGGKTAIDAAGAKNLVGAFHQPRLVLADIALLDSLPDRELRSGLAEVVKYGLLGDGPFFAWLEAHAEELLARDREASSHAVGRCVQMKAAIVARDETEAGERALLNLGHTFGHALEAESGLGEVLTHGEAVALGCALAARFSASRGLMPPADAERTSRLIARLGLPTRLAEVHGAAFGAQALIARMAQDKKASEGRLTLILLEAIGAAFIARDVDARQLEDFMISEGAGP